MNNNISPVNILLIEDNPGDARLVRETLRDSKLLINIFHVSDGQEAMEFLRKEGKYIEIILPDLILLDLNLPKKSGHEILMEIKNDEELKIIPVIVMTVSKAEEDIVRSYSNHANCYITKPLDFTQFIKVVQTIEEFWFSIVKLPSR